MQLRKDQFHHLKLAQTKFNRASCTSRTITRNRRLRKSATRPLHQKSQPQPQECSCLKSNLSSIPLSIKLKSFSSTVMAFSTGWKCRMLLRKRQRRNHPSPACSNTKRSCFRRPRKKRRRKHQLGGSMKAKSQR